jgi:predicted GIY-YIG superfamily endonuclease
LKEHRSGQTKAGQILKEFNLIHTEVFDDYSAAREREKFFKSGQGRKWIKNNLNIHGPPEAGKASP